MLWIIRQEELNFKDISITQLKYYYIIIALVAWNILLPWIVHGLPQWWLVFLPIYFFVLVWWYKFWWKVGLATALLSPLANHLFTGMPPTAMLRIILMKWSILWVLAGLLGKYTNKLSITYVIIAVVWYQLLGSLIEWSMSDILIWYPGILLQIIWWYLALKVINKYAN